VLRQERRAQLGDHRVVVPDDPREPADGEQGPVSDTIRTGRRPMLPQDSSIPVFLAQTGGKSQQKLHALEFVEPVLQRGCQLVV
jgi:hypothetical protein